MPVLSFKAKLLLAMLVVVAGGSGSTLYFTQKKNQEFSAKLYARQFQLQSESFSGKQELQINNIKAILQILVRSSRIQNALSESEGKALYRFVNDEMKTRNFLAREGEPANPFQANSYLFFNGEGQIIPPTPEALPGLKPWEEQTRLRDQLGKVSLVLTQMNQPFVAYVTPETKDGAIVLQQAVVTKVVDITSDEYLGAIVSSFPIPEFDRKGASSSELRTGILFENRIFSTSIPETAQESIVRGIRRQAPAAGAGDGEAAEVIDREPYRVFSQPLNSDSNLPPAHLVALVSIKQALEQQRVLRRTIFILGGIGLLGALVLSLGLSHGLSVPILELVKGTTEIQQGNFQVRVPVRSRDEIGRLAGSFNEMAKGLEEKEKFRSILNKVTDKRVAQEFIDGKVKLGGEMRQISVLFCDIRGFTALTQNMDPAEAIRMLNEHFTPLARLVEEHHGIVDKFVGDLIMAIFGAPKSYGEDAVDAVRCALAMLRVRTQLNATSRYQIQMGIGVASGPALAGCMGSEDRLNYTVIGERVNLASRLCSKAGRMEVVIDETTHARLKDRFSAEPLGELELKGFSTKPKAFKLLDVIATPEPVTV